jgi:hypothetical protein
MGNSTRVVRAVMVFDNLVAPALEVGANFTTVGRVVSVNGRPFEGAVLITSQKENSPRFAVFRLSKAAQGG